MTATVVGTSVSLVTSARDSCHHMAVMSRRQLSQRLLGYNQIAYACFVLSKKCDPTLPQQKQHQVTHVYHMFFFLEVTVGYLFFMFTFENSENNIRDVC